MTRMLIIDTCTERGLVAFSEGSQVQWEKSLPFGLQSSSALMPAVEEGLDALSWTVEDIGAVAVTVGPGSYTGIRVGASVAQAVSYARELPLIGVCSLYGYVPSSEGRFAALIDAKIGGAYVLMGEGSGPELVALGELRERVGDDALLVTPNAGRLMERVRECDPEWNPRWEEVKPSAGALLIRALEKWEAGQFSKDGRVPLLYLRKTQAEIEKEAEAVDR